MVIREVKVNRALNPTSIDLGEYVINPYKGCAYGCQYCYARFNKSIMNDQRQWGTYVDIRINICNLLKRELDLKRPKRVLIGSVTECFQPIESRYRLMEGLLKLLNDYGVFYNILTRSPIILSYIHLLDRGYCEGIYFTINKYPTGLKRLIEPSSPDFDKRMDTVDILFRSGVPVNVYCSPLFPFITDIEFIFHRFRYASRIEFEGLNFNLGNICNIISSISSFSPELKYIYFRMRDDPAVYEDVWQKIRKRIVKEAIKHKMNYKLYIHRFNSYFENRYR